MNKDSTCFICGKPLTKSNLTKEHIFLAFLGDNLKDGHLICKHCNSKLGNQVDGPFSNTLRPLVKILNINNRDSNPYIPAIDKNINIPLLLNTKSHKVRLRYPKFKMKCTRDGHHIHIDMNGYFSNKNDAIQILRTKLLRIHVKHPENAIKQMHFKSYNHKPEIIIPHAIPNFRFTSIEFIKMATEFALYCGINKKYLSYEHLALKTVLRSQRHSKWMKDFSNRIFDAILIITLYNQKIDNKYFNNQKDITKVKALLFVHNKRLYCSISFLGFLYSIPVALDYEFIPRNNKRIIAEYNFE